MSAASRGLVVLVLAFGLAGCATGPAPTRPAYAPTPPTSEQAPQFAARPAGLVIPSIGVNVSDIASLGLDGQGAMVVPKDAITTGWYAPGPAPGEVGPAVIAAHVNYEGTPGTFARLHEVRPGDEITVPREDGSSAAFRVDRVEQYDKDQFPTERVYGNTPGPELRLITCGGPLNPAERSYEDNVVVFASLL